MSKRNVSTIHRPAGARREAAALEPGLHEIFGSPPLFEGENLFDYCDLHDRLRSAVAPEDVVEELWVRDVADLAWEALRLRRLKAKLMGAVFRQGLSEALRGLADNDLARYRLVDQWFRGDVDAKQQVDDLLKNAGFDRGTIEVLTLVKRIDDFERIDRLIMQSEARRNAVLREIDRHREAVARRLRDAVVEYDDAEFEEVAKPDAEVPA